MLLALPPPMRPNAQAAWARTSGNELLSIDQQGKEYHFVVKKNK